MQGVGMGQIEETTACLIFEYSEYNSSGGLGSGGGSRLGGTRGTTRKLFHLIACIVTTDAFAPGSPTSVSGLAMSSLSDNSLSDNSVHDSWPASSRLSAETVRPESRRLETTGTLLQVLTAAQPPKMDLLKLSQPSI